MSSVVQKVGWLVRQLRQADPLNVYIVLTSAGIVWIGALGTIFYRNPLTVSLEQFRTVQSSLERSRAAAPRSDLL
jgi:hypothetical protein